MCIEWKDKKSFIGKCGDLLLARRSLEISPSEVLLEDGYLENSVSHYYIRDHLGNNRVVASSGGSIIQKNYYYPFGMSYADDVAPAKQPYKYNGKELDSMNGLNQYDYSARHYDPAIGRFMTVDPLAEDFYHMSPYSAFANNPLRFSDPTGMSAQDTITGETLPEVTVTARVTQAFANGLSLFLYAFTQQGRNINNALGNENATFYDNFNTSMMFYTLALAPVSALTKTGNTGKSANVKNTKSLKSIFKTGRKVKASELVKFAEGMGWKKVQTPTGPIKYVDEKGIVRLTIKKGSSRTPGSNMPHVEVRNESGVRIDPRTESPTNKRTLGNHTEIDYDL